MFCNFTSFETLTPKYLKDLHFKALPLKMLTLLVFEYKYRPTHIQK